MEMGPQKELIQFQFYLYFTVNQIKSKKFAGFSTTNVEPGCSTDSPKFALALGLGIEQEKEFQIVVLPCCWYSWVLFGASSWVLVAC